MSNNYKQKHAKVQEILNAAEKGGGGGTGGTTDYTDLSNKPSINSVTLSGNKTSSDLGIKEVPTIGQGDTGKLLKANFNSGNPQAEWTTINQVPSSTSSDENKVLTVNSSGTPTWTLPAAPAIEYADYPNIHLEYDSTTQDITGTYEVNYNGFFTIMFNVDYKGLAQYLQSDLEAGLIISFDYGGDYPAEIVNTTLYFPSSTPSSPQFMTNNNITFTIPVKVGDEIAVQLSGISDLTIGGNIAAYTSVQGFGQQYVTTAGD